MEPLDVSAYLRGQEVAIRLAIREEASPVGPPAEDCKSETLWVRLGAYEVAGIEEEFGGRLAFSDAFENRPTFTFLRVLAIIQHKPLVDAELAALGTRLFISERPAYLASLEAAWHIAHGMEEEGAGKVWRSRAAIVEGQEPAALEAHERILKAIDRAMRTGSRGKSGSKNGRSQAGASASSGS